MSDRTALTLLYDGTFEGLLTCIYDCYYERIKPIDILPEDLFDQLTLSEKRFVTTDSDKFERVYAAIKDKISNEARELVMVVYLSQRLPHISNEMAIYRFLVKGFKMGRSIVGSFGLAEYMDMHKFSLHTLRETHLLKGFVRFSIADNVMYSKINPKNNVLPLLAPHFCDRYKNEQFIIYDEGRKLALVYKPYSFIIIDADFSDNSAFSEGIVPVGKSLSTSLQEDDDRYQKLWKAFYNAIAIEGRYNPRCRMSLMPKRFWGNMLEMEDSL